MRCDACDLPRMVRALHADWLCLRLWRCRKDADRRRERAGSAQRPSPHGVRMHYMETLQGCRRLRPHND